MKTVQVNFYKEIDDHKIRFVVICCQYQGKWIFAQHNLRTTYEIPGGHREVKECVMQAACRELEEETGAYDYIIEPITVYGVRNTTTNEDESYGMLCYANVKKLGKLQYEIKSIAMYDDLPRELTYPLIQLDLFLYVKKWQSVSMNPSL